MPGFVSKGAQQRVPGPLQYYPVTMQTMSLQLPDELMARLATESVSRRVTRSQIVEETLARAFGTSREDQHVSCYDLAWDLIGTATSLPSDIATNPRYMEG